MTSLKKRKTSAFSRKKKNFQNKKVDKKLTKSKYNINNRLNKKKTRSKKKLRGGMNQSENNLFLEGYGDKESTTPRLDGSRNKTNRYFKFFLLSEDSENNYYFRIDYFEYDTSKVKHGSFLARSDKVIVTIEDSILRIKFCTSDNKPNEYLSIESDKSIPNNLYYNILLESAGLGIEINNNLFLKEFIQKKLDQDSSLLTNVDKYDEKDIGRINSYYKDLFNRRRAKVTMSLPKLSPSVQTPAPAIQAPGPIVQTPAPAVQTPAPAVHTKVHPSIDPSVLSSSIYSQKPTSPSNENNNLLETCTSNQRFCIECQEDEIKRLVFDGFEYEKNQDLGKGAFGKVSLYLRKEGDKNLDQLAVKYFDKYNEFIDESNVSKFLGQFIKNSDKNFSIIPSYVPTNCPKYIILHAKNGNLYSLFKTPLISSLIENNTPEIKKLSRSIYKSVITNILNLFENDIFYCDLKIPNLLYSYRDIQDLNSITRIDYNQLQSKLKIYLADIGGIVFTKEFFNTNKIIPYTYFKKTTFTYMYVDNQDNSSISELNIKDIYRNNIDHKIFILNFIHQIFHFRYLCLVSPYNKLPINISKAFINHDSTKKTNFKTIHQSIKANLRETFRQQDQVAFDNIYFPDLSFEDIYDSSELDLYREKNWVIKFNRYYFVGYPISNKTKNFEHNKKVITEILQLLLRCQDD